MKEERMTILRMVAEGKISADEAETLLEALGGGEQEERFEQSERHARWATVLFMSIPEMSVRKWQVTRKNGQAI